MGWFDWFWSALTILPVGRSEQRVCFLGLDNSGKTTLLLRLSSATLKCTPPTVHPQCEEVKFEKNVIKVYDLGGNGAFRPLWDTYLGVGGNGRQMDGIVYLLDVSDTSRFLESAEELHRVLSNGNLDPKIPLLILANKADVLEKAAARQTSSLPSTSHEIAVILGLGTNLEFLPAASAGRPISIHLCSVFKKSGYDEGLRWLCKEMHQR